MQRVIAATTLGVRMRDALHTGSTCDLDALAEQVRAEHRAKFSKRRVNEYAGLKALRFRMKYADCEYVELGKSKGRAKGLRVRKLMTSEIDAMLAHVGRCHEERS